MGSAQSVQAVASETVLTGVVVAVAVGCWYFSGDVVSSKVKRQPSAARKKGKKKPAVGSGTTGASSDNSPTVATGKGKGAKKQQSKQSIVDDQADIESADPVAPGGLPTSSTPPPPSPSLPRTTSEKKKRKAKKPAAPTDQADVAPASVPVAGPSSQQPVASSSAASNVQAQGLAGDGPWTNVKRKPNQNRADSQRGASSGEGEKAPGKTASTRAAYQSDAGVTTSVTEEEGSMSERRSDADGEDSGRQSDNKRTLAEKLLPKPRKTAVDDMLETPLYPDLSRVMRIQPETPEIPPGFSRGDFEDLRDDDGEDDEAGWGLVTRSKPRTPVPEGGSGGSASSSQHKATEALSKKQRQNQAKHQAAKSAKAEQEAQRLAALRLHKKGLEKTRMEEQAKMKASGGLSGGMTASVDQSGRLIFE